MTGGFEIYFYQNMNLDESNRKSSLPHIVIPKYTVKSNLIPLHATKKSPRVIEVHSTTPQLLKQDEERARQNTFVFEHNKMVLDIVGMVKNDELNAIQQSAYLKEYKNILCGNMKSKGFSDHVIDEEFNSIIVQAMRILYESTPHH